MSTPDNIIFDWNLGNRPSPLKKGTLDETLHDGIQCRRSLIHPLRRS